MMMMKMMMTNDDENDNNDENKNGKMTTKKPRSYLKFQPVDWRHLFSPFARWCSFPATTRILQGFAFFCKLGLLLF